MPDIEQTTELVTTLLTEYGVTRDQMAGLLGGPADGGPNSDGYYPVTVPNGDTILVPSPQRIAAMNIDTTPIVGQRLTSYGAKPDGRHLYLVTMAVGSNLLNHAAGGFRPTDVGLDIAVAAAGGDNIVLRSKVAEYISPQQVRLADAAAPGSYQVQHQSATLGTDCGPALQAAFNDAANIGTTVIILDGDFALFSPVTKNFAANGEALNTGGVELRGIGGWGSILRVACRPDKVALEVINGGLSFRSVSLVGTHGAAQDALHVVRVNTGTLTAQESGFYGLMTLFAGSVITATKCTLRIQDSYFGGCSGNSGLGISVIDATFCRGATFDRTNFIDYGTLKGLTYSKTGIGSAFAWVNLRSMEQAVRITSFNQGVFRFTDCRMDEGAYHHIAIGLDEGAQVDRVVIDGHEGNAFGAGIEGCIKVQRARVVDIQRSSFGYVNGQVYPAVNVQYCDDVKLDAIQVGRETTVTTVRAYDCNSVAITRSPGFTAYDVQRVVDFSIDRKPGLVARVKNGPVSDADFVYPPVKGTLALDSANKRLNVKLPSGAWLGIPLAALDTSWRPTALFTAGIKGGWYDPSDMATMWQDYQGTIPAAVGQPVGKISDKSGNGAHAIQGGSPAARPILRSSGGRNYLEFTGVEHLYIVDTNDLRTTGVLGSVAGSINADATGAFYAKSVENMSPGRYMLLSNQQGMGAQYIDAANVNRDVGGDHYNGNLPAVFAQHLNRAAGTHRVFVNNDVKGTAALPASSTDIDTTFPFIIGGNSNANATALGSLPLKGRIYDLVVCMKNATDAERDALHTYQNMKLPQG